MIENQLVDVMEVVKEIDLNKQVFEDNNEFESDIEDVLPEFADLNAVIACPQNVLPDTVIACDLVVLLSRISCDSVF
ncbi:hypothetical protein Tco_1512175 [Tanacetum coccineum]